MLEENEEYGLVDFTHFPEIGEREKDDVKDKINSFIDSFQQLFGEMTGKAINMTIKSVETSSFSEMKRLLSFNYSVSYTKQLIDNKDQFFISLSPSFVDSLMTSSLDKGKETFIKKAIADHFVLDIFKQLVTKNASSDYKEVPLVKGNTNSYSVIENKEENIKNLRFGQTNMMVNVELSSEKTEDAILISSTFHGWRKLLGKKKENYTQGDISLHNAFLILSDINMNDSHIKNLKKGEKIIFPLKGSGRMLPFVVNKRKIDDSLIVATKNNNVALLYSEVNKEEKDFFLDNSSNLFLLLGSKEIKGEELENIYENYSGHMETFDSHYNEDLPLLYNGKIIALAEYVTSHFSNYAKITKIFDEPITLTSF